MPQPRAAKDHHTSEHVRVAQVPGHLFAPQVLQAQRFPGGRRGHVVEDGGQESTHTGMAGNAHVICIHFIYILKQRHNIVFDD